MALPSVLSHEDLNKFRTRLCERLLQHGECSFGSKCQYSHNLGWRRRSPAKTAYRAQLCAAFRIVDDAEILECEDRHCSFAHSLEELLYHPEIYKKIPCAPRAGICTLYYCPFAHENFGNFSLTLAALGVPDFVDVGELLSEISFFQLNNFRSPASVQFPPLSPADLAISDHQFPLWVPVAPGLLVEGVIRGRSRSTESEITRGILCFRGERKAVVVKTLRGGFCGEAMHRVVAEHEKISDQELSIVRRVIGNCEEGVFVVMDRCVTSLEQGISDSLLRRLLPTLPRKLSEIFRQLARMHALGIAHMRLTPGNFLIDAEGSWRLGDFFGKLGERENLSWLAPELREKKFPIFEATNPFAADVWSAGATLLFATSGNCRKFPVFTQTARDVGLEEISDKFPTLADLLRRCTLPEPEDRPTVQEILEHPVFWTSEKAGNFFQHRLGPVLRSPGSVIVRSVLGEGSEIGNFCKFPITKLFDAVRVAELYSENLQLFFERYAIIDFGASEDERLARIAAATAGREVVALDRLLDESLLSEFEISTNFSERKNSACLLPSTPLSAATASSPWHYAVLPASPTVTGTGTGPGAESLLNWCSSS